MNIVKSYMEHVPPVFHSSYSSEKLGKKNISRKFSQHLQNHIVLLQAIFLLEKYFLILKGIFKFLSLDLSAFICAFTYL